MAIFTIDLNVRGSDHKIRYQLNDSLKNEEHILSYLRGGRLYEPEVSALLLRVVEDGDVVIDVGANMGFFTVLAGYLVGNTGLVLAYEPDNNNLDRLNENLILNGLSNVSVSSAPVANISHPVTFYINSDSNGGNTLWNPAHFPGNEKSKKNPKPIQMISTTLDLEAKKHPQARIKCIKIDTEGCEQLVLEGAYNLLEQAHIPFIVAELHEFGLNELGFSQNSLRSYMSNCGYQTFALSADGDLPHLVPSKTQLYSDQYINVLFSTEQHIEKYWTNFKPKPVSSTL